VKARQLIKGAVYDPAALKVIYKAFDDAWDQIAPAVSGRADALEATRLKLANVILGLASNGARDAQALADAAVQAMKLRP
jgi:hypothetical protein